MKKVINGKSYNTETASLIHYIEQRRFLRDDDMRERVLLYVDRKDGIPHTQENTTEDTISLYQSPSGDFFTSVRVLDPRSHFDAGWHYSIEPKTYSEAYEWLLGWDQESKACLIEEKIGKPSIQTVRIPQSLKARMDKELERRGQSANAWILARIEESLTDSENVQMYSEKPDVSSGEVSECGDQPQKALTVETIPVPSPQIIDLTVDPRLRDVIREIVRDEMKDDTECEGG